MLFSYNNENVKKEMKDVNFFKVESNKVIVFVYKLMCDSLGLHFDITMCLFIYFNENKPVG